MISKFFVYKKEEVSRVSEQHIEGINNLIKIKRNREG